MIFADVRILFIDITFIDDLINKSMGGLLVILLIPLLISPALTVLVSAESQTLPTDKGTLNVMLTYDAIEPNIQSKINVNFINPQTEKTQEHIDYTITVVKDGENVFGPIPLTHTSVGIAKIPITFNLGEGVYAMNFEIEGILFQPIPTETVSFDILVGDVVVPNSSNNGSSGNSGDDNGGCLIATAAYGSELAPQVQQLREIRDNVILSTESGTAFMTGFNSFYYSFSPAIADLEREQPIFRQAVQITLTPMLSSLYLLNYVDIDSEQEMLGYGISLIVLNIGMYLGIPVFGVIKLYQFRRN